MKTLNIIGAGKVGQTLAALWHAQSVFSIGAVCNRGFESAQAAVEFMGAGMPLTATDDGALPPADVWLLACGDDDLQTCCQQLAARGLLQKDNIVFHCSGALTADEALQSAKHHGAHIASIHPIKSFVSPALAVRDFAGTFCGAEGDANALDVLVPAFEAIGAQPFTIKPEAKTLYHAASVIACNYLVALQELSLQTFEQAGIERAQAMAILQPMVESTASNVFNVGTAAALTGPIARGDAAVVTKQLDALRDWNLDYAVIYQQLGRIALQLAQHNSQLERILTAKN